MPPAAALFAALATATSSPVIGLYGDGTLFEWNAAAAALFGVPREAAIGLDYIERFLPANVRAAVRADLARVCDGRETRDFESEVCRRDGERVTLRWTVLPIIDVDGASLGALAVGADVPVERDAASALRASEERLRLAMEGAQDGYWDVHVASGHCIYSPRWCAMLGRTPDEVPATPAGWTELVHPDDLPAAAAAFEAHVAGGAERYDVEFRMRHADGRWVWIRARGQAVERDAAGRAVRVLGTHTDISRRKIAEAMLRRRTVQLELAMDAARLVTWTWNVRDDRATHGASYAAVLAHTGAPPTTLAEFLAQVHPEDRDRVRAALLRAAYETGTLNEEFRSFSSTGATVWVESRASLVRDHDGVPLSLVGVAMDVSERKARELELRAAAERFRRISFTSPAGVFEATLSGEVTFVSPRLLGIWEQSEAEARGMGWLARVHPEDATALLADWRAANAAGRDHEHEFRLAFPDGRVRQIDARTTVVRDADGTPRSCVGTLEDVTERRAAEQALVRQALAFGTMSEAVLFTDAEGAITDWNPAAERLFGYTRAEALGRSPAMLWPYEVDAAARVTEVLGALARTGEWRGVLEVVRRDGSRGTMESVVVPIREADGTIVGTVGVNRDIGEQLRLEQRLRQAEKMEAVGLLAGGIAHDFNNLLTVIRGNLDFARGAADPTSELATDLAEVDRAAERASELVRQLLTFSRRQAAPAVGSVPLDAVVGDAARLLRRVIGEEVTLEVALDAPGAAVAVDRTRLEQVLMNLVVNARDAVRGGGTIRVRTAQVAIAAAEAARLGLRQAGAHARLTVEDDGVGIDAAALPHIFEPFFTTKGVGHGTGLGLATVWGIVTQEGGAIDVASTPGVGTRFTVLLPHQPAADAPGGAAGPAADGGTETVLVVEDEPAVRQTVARVLRRAGYSVLEAGDGEEGWARWSGAPERIALVLSDVRMPRLGGIALAERLHAAAPALPVVLMSGYADRPLAPQELARLGPVLEKPFAAGALLGRVREVLGAGG